MVLGTASHVGKSLVATGFCRLLAERKLKVAPFKAQNMALNSSITRAGCEIGRAQAVQADAAGIEPTVEMNPVLLKPMGGVSQVVVEGEPAGVMSAREYYASKDRIWPKVAACYDRLASQFDYVVLEGAGSPVEVNLEAQDLTNLRMARYADAANVIVADIERGGVFAQLIGTWELLPTRDRARVVGFIINKFRGDVSLLDSGLEFVRSRTGVPVLGVLPYRSEIQVDQEDSLGLEETKTPRAGELFETVRGIDVAVVRLPHISNFTDFWALSRVPGVTVRYVDRHQDLRDPSLVILPGTKATVLDLQWLRARGLDEAIVRLARDESGPVILGICGGFQMLGRSIDDPLGVESAHRSTEGLGLVAMTTRFEPEKCRHRVRGRSVPESFGVVGYEIHMGVTTRDPGVPHRFELTREGDGAMVQDGASACHDRVLGTYIHGLFDSHEFTAGLIDRLRRSCGLEPLSSAEWEGHRARLADRYGPLADFLREHLDLCPVWNALG
jgi:adenosylcobyric acid synthase